MRIETGISADWEASLAALAWQYDCGIDEAIGEAPVNRYEVEAERAAIAAAAPREAPPPSAGAPRAAAKPAPVTLAEPPPAIDAAAVATARAAAAGSLEALRDAVEGFDLCELKRGARNTVFADGNPKARVLILGEAPGRDENIRGLPFVGRAGQLLDRMFAAIGLSRQSPDAGAALYITNVMFWQPPGNRDPEPAELAMTMPFVERHIALADPDVIVVMGNVPLSALTGQRGITRMRGKWTEALGKPVLPMLHPAYLLRQPAAKREAWADLLSLQAKLRGPG